MSYNGITVYVDATTIAHELARDTELAYEVFQKIADTVSQSQSSKQYFIDDISKDIFENEDTTLLSLLEEIVKSFTHLKETND